MPIIDIRDQRFGRLVAVEQAGRYRRRHVIWRCRCDCGSEPLVLGYNLRHGLTRSCGCLRSEVAARTLTAQNLTHGESRSKQKSREYQAWTELKRRCCNPKCARFAYYGGRGIKVCERWQVFENFLADMGRCPPGYSLDRIDNDGPYAPENCRWATASEQQKNKRKNKPLGRNSQGP